MKPILKITIFTLSLLFIQNCTAQDLAVQQKYTAQNKGKLFISFGGNRGYFTKSDIHFKGNDFNFTIDGAKAHDRPQGWHIDYVNPAKMTIPQNNYRVGYFVNNHYSISIGVDHMKYVFSQNQTANVSGTINLHASDPGSVYNGTYNNTPINFADGTFLKFEHTDGLNYVSTEISRFDDISTIFSFFKSINPDKFQINLTEGVGVGLLYPRTNAVVLGKAEYDEFQIAGYGVSAKAGLNFTFYKHFFIQTELKTGYINMPNIRITSDKSEKASQQFGYFQTIISFGAIFKI